MSLSMYQLRELQDKTTPKGAYFFFSFSIVIFTFITIGIVIIESFLFPIKYLGIYILILSLASLITAFLYYIKPDILLLKFIL